MNPPSQLPAIARVGRRGRALWRGGRSQGRTAIAVADLSGGAQLVVVCRYSHSILMYHLRKRQIVSRLTAIPAAASRSRSLSIVRCGVSATSL